MESHNSLNNFTNRLSPGYQPIPYVQNQDRNTSYVYFPPKSPSQHQSSLIVERPKLELLESETNPPKYLTGLEWKNYNQNGLGQALTETFNREAPWASQYYPHQQWAPQNGWQGYCSIENPNYVHHFAPVYHQYAQKPSTQRKKNFDLHQKLNWRQSEKMNQQKFLNKTQDVQNLRIRQEEPKNEKRTQRGSQRAPAEVSITEELYSISESELARMRILIKKIVSANNMKSVSLDWLNSQRFALHYADVNFSHFKSKIKKLCDKIIKDRYSIDQMSANETEDPEAIIQEKSEMENINRNKLYTFKSLQNFSIKKIEELAKEKKSSLKLKKSISFLNKKEALELFSKWRCAFKALMVLPYGNFFLKDLISKSKEALTIAEELLTKNLKFFALNYCALKTLKSFVSDMPKNNRLVLSLVSFIEQNHKKLAHDIQFASLSTFLVKQLGPDPFKNTLDFVIKNPRVLNEKNRVKKFYISLLLQKNDRDLYERLFMSLKNDLPTLTKSLHGHRLVVRFLEHEIGDCEEQLADLAAESFPKYFSLKNSATLLLPLFKKRRDIARRFCAMLRNISFATMANEMIEVVKSKSGVKLMLFVFACYPCEQVYKKMVSFILLNIAVLAKSSYSHDLMNQMMNLWKIGSENGFVN